MLALKQVEWMRSSDSEKILVAVDVKTNCAYDYKCNKKTKKWINLTSI